MINDVYIINEYHYFPSVHYFKTILKIPEPLVVTSVDVGATGVVGTVTGTFTKIDKVHVSKN